MHNNYTVYIPSHTHIHTHTHTKCIIYLYIITLFRTIHSLISNHFLYKTSSPQVLSTLSTSSQEKTPPKACNSNGLSCRHQHQGQGQRLQGQNSRSRHHQRGFKFTWKQIWTSCSVSCGVGKEFYVFERIVTHVYLSIIYIQLIHWFSIGCMISF